MTEKSTPILWLIGLSIYFIGIISIFTFATNIDNSIAYSDGGVTNIEQLRSQGGSCDYPKQTNWNGQFMGYKTNSCEDTFLNTNETCSAITNCTWSDERFFIPFFENTYFGEVYCKGEINVSSYNGGLEVVGDRICEASDLDSSEQLCQQLGCTWIDYSKVSQEQLSSYAKPSPSNVIQSIGFLTGVRADFGVSGFLYFIISFFLFYIPFILLIGALYMLVPII